MWPSKKRRASFRIGGSYWPDKVYFVIAKECRLGVGYRSEWVDLGSSHVQGQFACECQPRRKGYSRLRYERLATEFIIVDLALSRSFAISEILHPNPNLHIGC